MFKKILFSIVIFTFFSAIAVMPHGSEEHKEHEEKVEKVSTQMQMENEHAPGDSASQAEEKEAMEKDFAQIHEDVENSTTPTVIKAVSLATVIAGLAFLYLPRKRKGDSNV